MHALTDELIEVKFAWLERILAGVRARERKEVLDDVREALGFLVQHSQRFPVLLRGARLLGKSDLRLATQNGNRRPQFVRRVGHEAPLAFEGLAEPVEQAVERPRQGPQFVSFILDPQPLPKITRPNPPPLAPRRP